MKIDMEQSQEKLCSRDKDWRRKTKEILEYKRKTPKEQTKEENGKEVKLKISKLQITIFSATYLHWIYFRS